MATKQSGLSVRFDEFKETWQTLSLYERIEQVIALGVTYWLIRDRDVKALTSDRAAVAR